MDLLQEELKQMMDLWNTHVIRSSRAETIGGIPDELYFFPEVTGIEQVQLRNYYANIPLLVYLFCVGADNYMCDISGRDLHVCKQYIKEKPAPVPIEFLNLVEILMTENNLYMPDTCEEALSLYLDLVDLIQ